jgi:hypothetical protein
MTYTDKLSRSFRCGQNINNHCYEFGHTVLLLKCDLNYQAAWANLLNKGSRLALGATKFMIMNWIVVVVLK